MNKNKLLETIKKVRETSKKKNFTQSFDFIINLKFFDVKKENIDTYLTLPNTSKKIKICAIVDDSLSSQAKNTFDKIVHKDDFIKWQKDKKAVKKLANEYNYFVAQADLMGQVATTFGKVFGPKGKMPNPKAGCVVPNKLPSLEPIYNKLQKTIKISNKSQASIKCRVGNENMKDEEIADNLLTVYNSVIHSLPQEEGNVKNALLKLTMGKPIEIK